MHVVQFLIATEAEVADYVTRGAIGIIAGHFIERQGAAVLGPLDDWLIGADHATLAEMIGLLVLSGLHKAETTRAALRGGFVDHLVVDLKLAEVLLSAEA